ncbi:MAG: hypothetical protein AAF385_05855 [Pseudomonadota bacterium]
MTFIRLLAVVVLWPIAAHSEEPKPLFLEAAPLKAVLSAPMRQLNKQKRSDERMFLPGHWSYVNSEGVTNRLDISVRTRGVFRRANCRQPPLQLNFKKKAVRKTLFAGQDRLKLVVPCARGDAYQQQLYLEFLAYQLYDVVSDGPAFSTRLLDLSYVDTEKKTKPRSLPAFVIEDHGDLAKRHGYKVPQIRDIRVSQLAPDQTARLELFQYMIGNTDYSTVAPGIKGECCHNVKLLRDADDERSYTPVPYDFDSAGIVNAPYARPSEKLPITSVRKRLYIGRCKDPVHLESAAAHFLARQANVFAAVENAAGLTDKNRKKARVYLKRFFDIIADEKRRQLHLHKACREK